MFTIREYPLACVEARGAETRYTLVFADDGRMFVRSVLQYDRAFERGEQKEIQPPDFPGTQVEGVALSKLVAKKLDEILPEPPRKYPEYLTSM